MIFPAVGYAISGKAGAGKTTLGRALQAELKAAGFSSCVTAFATELKREVKELYGLDKSDPGGRAKLIQHGESKRLENPDYWIDRCAEIVDGSQRSGLTCVIDDLRFQREFDWVKRRGFITVRLQAPVDVRAARLKRDGNETGIAQSLSVYETELDSVISRFDNLYWDDDGDLDLQVVAYELVQLELRYHQAGLSRPLPELAV